MIKLNSSKLKASGGSRPLDKVEGGGVGRSLRPSDKDEPGLQKKFFWAQFSLKILGKSDPGEARAPPLDPPLEAIASSYYDLNTLPLFNALEPLRSGFKKHKENLRWLFKTKLIVMIGPKNFST